MAKEQEKYIFVFSSNYHGYYAEDLLARNNIKNSFRKAPRAIGKSCQAAIYINEQDFEKVKEIIVNSRVSTIGIYEIVKKDKVDSYQKIF